MARISTTNTGTANWNPLARGVALITGGSRGIGRAIAHKLASLGASVSICGRDRAALEETARGLASIGVPVHSQIADVTKQADVADLVAKTEAKLGPITVLVNNAGIGLFGPTHEKTESDWDRVLDTNLKSVFLVSRAVVPSMIHRGSGDVINISSLAGKSTFAGGGIYCASNGVLSAFPAAWPRICADTASVSVWFALEVSPRISPGAAPRIRPKY